MGNFSAASLTYEFPEVPSIAREKLFFEKPPSQGAASGSKAFHLRTPSHFR